MDDRERSKAEEILFERIVSGEDSEQLRTQLYSRLSPADADRLIAEAHARIEQGRGHVTFERLVRKIRKRRLVGRRFLAAKLIAGFFISMSILSFVLDSLAQGQVTGSIGWFLLGVIMLLFVEFREERIIRPREDEGSAE